MFSDAFAKEPRTVPLCAILANIREGKYRLQVEGLRELRTKDAEAYAREKRKLPAFCVSGTAESRTKPLIHSGLLQIDLDHLNGTLDPIRKLMMADPYVAFGFTSPSGFGLKLALAIDGTRHAESFEAALEYFKMTYDLEIDPAVKDKLRLCFVSHDPQSWTNEAAVPLPILTSDDPQPEPGRQSSAEPTVLVLPSGAVTISESARAIFTRIGPSHTLFWRGGALVELTESEGVATLDVIKPDSFRSRAERHGFIMSWRSGREGEPVLRPAKMSKDDATALLAAAEAREILPAISTLLRCAVMVETAPGEVAVLGKGYHEDSGGILISTGEPPPQVPVGEAVEALKWLVEEFDFQTEGDRSRALAALVTPALRIGGHLRGNVPIDVAEADQSQSGKGYRQQLICELYNEPSRFVTARQGGVGSVDESFSAALVSGRPFIVLDNFRGRLDSQNLEAFLTCPSMFPARVPYHGEIMVDPKRFLLQMSSNGLEATRDLVNRASICRIRKRPGFQYRDTLGDLQSRQPFYLGCVFAVIGEWIANGKPKTSDTRHDFREWAQILDWIVRNVFQTAPLMDGHQAAQDRASNPALSWLRAVALAVDREGKIGESMIASELVELSTLHEIEVPGLKDPDDDKARKQVGILMRRCFKDASTVDIDGFTITRAVSLIQRSEGGSIESKNYTFTKV